MSTSEYYIILLQTSLGRQKFKGLYTHDGNGKTSLIYNMAKIPSEIPELKVDKYYRYNSGAKEFQEVVGMKAFHVSTDAVSLSKHVDKSRAKHKNVAKASHTAF